MPRIAEYDGTCPCGCDERIREGESVIQWSIEHQGWVKQGHTKTKEFCPKCFTERSAAGTCACSD